MTVLALILAAVLLVIACFHLLWAIGFWVPIRDEAALARAVVGAQGIRRMPGAVPCALVAVVLIFVASLLFTPDFPGQTLLLGGAAAVFLGRGALAYSSLWRARLPEHPFAELDRRVYGPLCLVLGAGLALIVLTGG